jgi:hypothetical protein
MLGQAVHGHSHTEAGKIHPLLWDGNDRAGDYQGMNSLRTKSGEDPAELAMSNQRLAANQRHMQRPVFANEVEHAIYEGLAAKIGELAQGRAASKMGISIRIAAGTVQRALASDFDGKHRSAAVEYVPPARQHFGHSHTRVSFSARHEWLDAGQDVPEPDKKAGKVPAERLFCLDAVELARCGFQALF